MSKYVMPLGNLMVVGCPSVAVDAVDLPDATSQHTAIVAPVVPEPLQGLVSRGILMELGRACAWAGLSAADIDLILLNINEAQLVGRSRTDASDAAVEDELYP